MIGWMEYVRGLEGNFEESDKEAQNRVRDLRQKESNRRSWGRFPFSLPPDKSFLASVLVSGKKKKLEFLSRR